MNGIWAILLSLSSADLQLRGPGKLVTSWDLHVFAKPLESSIKGSRLGVTSILASRAGACDLIVRQPLVCEVLVPVVAIVSLQQHRT